MMSVSQSYVWYVGYGSNLCEERFLCYILGEKFKWGGKKADACKDKTPPKANKPIRIPYSLYFAKNSCWWEDSGVSFISPERKPDENKLTLGRMWKITCEQYEHVRRQEGKDRYNHEIYLEEEDDFPIRTITNKEILTPYNRPSAGYLKTIALGLKEICHLTTNEKIAEYLIAKSGIKDNFSTEELISIIVSATTSNTA
jgi:hypothetical protein